MNSVTPTAWKFLIFILYCIMILILGKFFIWKTNCIANFFKNYLTLSCKCNCIRSLLYNYNFLFLVYIAFPASHGGLNMMIQYIGHYVTAIGTIAGHLMVDLFLLHFSDFCLNVKILKTLKAFFFGKSLTFRF